MSFHKGHWLAALAQVILYFGLIVVVHAVTGPRNGLLASFGFTQWVARIADAAIYLLAILLATALYCALVNRASLDSLGLAAHGMSNIVVGFALGLLLMVCIFMASLGMGWISITGFAWTQTAVGELIASLAALIALQIASAISEELIFRGYILQRLSAGFGFTVAALISSLLFAAVHTTNPNASIWSALPLAFPGLLLAAQYRLIRSLWMPIGFHFAWNVTEGLVGFPLSGVSTFSLINISTQGPAVFIGGGFGPEGGLLGVLACILGLVVLYGWTKVSPMKPATPDLSPT